MPYIGLAITIAGIVFQGGVLTSRVATNSDRLAKVEAVQASIAATINDVNTRGVKNEAKLDFLVEQAMNKPAGKNR